MELVKAGTLQAFIEYRKLKKSPITDQECSCIIRQILEGISYFHQVNIIHRDLKPQNILMKSFKNLEGAIKIADFGLGTQNSYGANENCGTMLFMSPEQFSEETYNKVIIFYNIGSGYMGNRNNYVRINSKNTPLI